MRCWRWLFGNQMPVSLFRGWANLLRDWSLEQKRALEDERASKLAGMTADLAAVSLKIEAEQVPHRHLLPSYM